MNENLQIAVVKLIHKSTKELIGTAFFINKSIMISVKHNFTNHSWKDVVVRGAWPGGGDRRIDKPKDHPDEEVDICLFSLMKDINMKKFIRISKHKRNILSKGDRVDILGYANESNELECRQLEVIAHEGVFNYEVLGSSIPLGYSGGPALFNNELVGVTIARHSDQNKTYIIRLSAFKDFLKSEIDGAIIFDTCNKEQVFIQPGSFYYGKDRNSAHIRRPYGIDKFPVTNSQFELFYINDGYNNDTYWSQTGKQWKNHNDIAHPQYWHDEKWNGPDFPVIGVSFYEAEAYANWYGGQLPSQEEWERAARGIDGRDYPWGNEFDKQNCNSKESGSSGTSIVSRYKNGISPVGCYDMAGNVWEWTTDYCEKNKSLQVLRGGSWKRSRIYCRTWDFVHLQPSERYSNVGFRCVERDY